MSIAIKQQYSGIKYLVIDYCCSLDKLIAMLSCTPQLCRLTCQQVNESDDNIVKNALNSILSLTRISIAGCYAEFDEAELFLTNVSPQLEVLRINTFRDVTYLDANRWKQIISQHLLHLSTFEFKYEEPIDEDFEATLESCIPISIANNEQYSGIKYLVIDHCCSLDDLIAILSYTSQLCRLTCYQLEESKKKIVKDALNSILSLTCISIAECSTKFDEIEMFLTNVSSQLEVLRINTLKDVNYLDANRWERIISQHLHHLNIFEFKYEELAREGLEVTVYHERLNEFNSLFWIKRKWFFRIYIDTRFHDDNMMIYSIYPYRETHSNFHKDKKNDESLSNDISQNLIQHGIILNDNVEYYSPEGFHRHVN
ncbi:unnamed protein product [Rotaria sordida]|uniref:Uncharacterized protein n=1 Tax=Rotaria sordida TaxID=392033 RepID=A0A813Z9H9_9BILA|nr:unnamed protein product [Rotaria sordida]